MPMRVRDCASVGRRDSATCTMAYALPNAREFFATLCMGVPCLLLRGNAADERAFFVQDAACGLCSPQTFDAIRVGEQFLAIALVTGQIGKIDQPECRIGRPRNLGRQIIGDEFAPTALDRLPYRACVSLEIGELVGVERVADAKRHHERLLEALVARTCCAPRYRSGACTRTTRDASVSIEMFGTSAP